MAEMTAAERRRKELQAKKEARGGGMAVNSDRLRQGVPTPDKNKAVQPRSSGAAKSASSDKPGTKGALGSRRYVAPNPANRGSGGGPSIGTSTAKASPPPPTPRAGSDKPGGYGMPKARSGSDKPGGYRADPPKPKAAPMPAPAKADPPKPKAAAPKPAAAKAKPKEMTQAEMTRVKKPEPKSENAPKRVSPGADAIKAAQPKRSDYKGRMVLRGPEKSASGMRKDK